MTRSCFIKDYDSQHVTKDRWEDFDSQHAVLWNSRSQNATLLLTQRAVETTVPSMERRPQFLAPRRTLLRRDVLDSRERALESQPSLGDVSAGRFWPVGPVQTEPRRDGLGPGPGFAQAAPETAPMGPSGGLPPFELRWRVGSLYPVPFRVGAAITMATAASQPCAGGPRDILWRVSAARAVAGARQLRGSGWACGRWSRVRAGRGRGWLECSVGSAWGGGDPSDLFQGCGGRPECRLVTEGTGVLGKVGYKLCVCGAS